MMPRKTSCGEWWQRELRAMQESSETYGVAVPVYLYINFILKLFKIIVYYLNVQMAFWSYGGPESSMMPSRNAQM